MRFCLKSLRDGECFCSRYDENRQTMFYCGFFTTIAGFIWFIIGFTIRCAFFAEAFGPSVDAVACGIMVVGLMILVIGLFSTISIVCTSKPNNKTRCVSTTTATSSIYSDDSSRRLRRNGDKQRMDKMFNVFDIPTTFKHHQHLEDGGHYPPTTSFGSSELNSSFVTRTSSSAMSSSSSSRPSTCSQNSQHCCRSDIVMIA